MTAVPPEDWPRPGRVVLTEARRRLDEVLDDSAATVADLTRFYDPGGDFAGPVFDDRTGTDPNEITAGDLLAITAMQVYAGPRAIGRFLRPGQPRRDVLAALRNTDDVPLWEASPKQLAAAAELYRVTKALFSAGNMWVSTGKLCARKRPRLIPVRDRVVVGGLGLPGTDFREDWLIIASLLEADDVRTELRTCAEQAASAGNVLPDVPVLRLLDAALWMRWSRGATASFSQSTRRPAPHPQEHAGVPRPGRRPGRHARLRASPQDGVGVGQEGRA